MTELVREWVQKAEADIRTAEREAHVAEEPNWDAVCFHAQQAVEKYLKAVLQQNAIAFPKVHDLAALLDMILPVHPEWETMRDSLEWLSAFAVEIRYPGEVATEEDAFQAIHIMRQTCSVVRQTLD
jgi:HEPN domain-containing protein